MRKRRAYPPPDVNPSGSDIYASINIQVPTASRAGTNDDGSSTDGFETGKDYENTVNDVTVVLATKDASSGQYTYRTHATTGNATNAETNTYTLKFDVNALNDCAGESLYIFTYCNVTPPIESWQANFADIITSEAPWTSDSFIMANASGKAIPSVTIDNIDDLRKDHSTPESAFDLGTVDVSRVCSRFDYKKYTADNTYEVKSIINDAKMGEIELIAMAPIEVATEYYYIPRVSADGTNTSWVYGGNERNNYVVSPYYDLKKAATLGSEILSKYKYRTSGTGVDLSSTTAYTWTTLSSWTGEDDNDDNWNDADGGDGFDKTNYKIWTYVPENTIPAINAQKQGISTGVLFKAKIKSATDPKFSNAMTAGKAIYEFEGTIYGDVEMLRHSAYAADRNSKLYKKFVDVFGTACLEIQEGTGSGSDVVFKNTISDATEQMNAKGDNNKPVFKIYRPTLENGTNNYYVYYIYRNRHNDNNLATTMGMMEFGTVRNNIYKLMVTKVSNFGFTSKPGDDPDFPDPDDPDEEKNAYFKVSCRVLNWMVRVNNIPF